MNRNMKETQYQKYKIPADFALAQLHARSCKLYEHMPDEDQANTRNKCGCCNQIVGSKLVSMCEYVSSLRRIGEEVPLFFNFITLMILLCLFVVFLKVGEYLFFCEDSCEIVKYHVQDMWGVDFSIILGFMNMENMEFMIEIAAYSFVILIIKIHLKARKYTYRSFNVAIEKRSVQLINLPKDCTAKDIEKLFGEFHVEEVIFAYRVREYHKYMVKIARLKKALRYMQSKIEHDDDQNVRRLQQKLQKNKKLLEQLLKGIRNKKKRLSIAFVVFATPEERNRALKKHHYGVISKAFNKLCVCCSKNVIGGQHVTVESAPAPDDIRWENLENPYLRTKAIRFSSFLICFTILVFGIVSEVIVFNTANSNSTTGQLLSSLVIFVINFMIVNFLEFTTHSWEAHQSNTHLKLSLTRKITFFMFVNVSVSPFLIMLYNRIVNQIPISSLFTTITLTVLIVSIGNFFKPLLTLLSVPRFLKWVKCVREKSKGTKSQLNQSEANQLFEPLEFPIEVYYSLLHAALMMSFFYLGCFQFLIIIELPSLVMLYFIAKWMLIRVCKQPRGLSLKLNNLAQSLMRFYVPLYWLGRNMILVTKLPDDQINFGSVVERMIYQDTYQIASTAIVGFMLICQLFVSKIAEKLTPKKSDLSEYYSFSNNRNYNEANLFFKIHEEGLTRHTIRIHKNNNKNMESQESEESIDLTNKRLI